MLSSALQARALVWCRPICGACCRAPRSCAPASPPPAHWSPAGKPGARSASAQAPSVACCLLPPPTAVAGFPDLCGAGSPDGGRIAAGAREQAWQLVHITKWCGGGVAINEASCSRGRAGSAAENHGGAWGSLQSGWWCFEHPGKCGQEAVQWVPAGQRVTRRTCTTVGVRWKSSAAEIRRWGGGGGVKRMECAGARST